MSKKRQANQPIVAEEPARPEEQFSLDQAESAVAPPSTRKRNERARASSAPRYGARSARERRAGRATASGAHRIDNQSLSQETVSDLLRHPTREVTEAQLREEYGYVLNDLRSMAIVSAGLIVLLIVLAQVLPK